MYIALVYVTGDVHKGIYIYITGIHITQYFRGAHNSWNILDRFGSTIAAMVALAVLSTSGT